MLKVSIVLSDMTGISGYAYKEEEPAARIPVPANFKN